MTPPPTTQKGVDKDKIFELRAETRTECSLRCQMTIAKKNFGCSAKPAARRGPKPVKNAIFGARHLVGPPHWVTDITVSPAAPTTPTSPSPASPAVSPAASPAAPAVPVAASRAKPPDQTMINISVYIRWHLEMFILYINYIRYWSLVWPPTTGKFTEIIIHWSYRC